MINLLPESIKEDMYYGRKNRQILSWITTSLFGMVILLLVAGFGRLTIQTARNQTLEQKQSMEEQLKLADYDAINGEYGEYVDGLGSVKKLYGQQILYTRLIRKLGTLLPPGARLTSISLSDKDQAVGLNFDNDSDGLGPVVQLNLTDQSKQVTSKTKTIFNQNLLIPLASEPSSTTDEQTLTFFVNANDEKSSKLLASSMISGGDLAFYSIKPQLTEFTVDFNVIEDAKTLNQKNEQISTALGKSQTTQPQIRSYKVDVNKKSVDFTVRASSLSETKALADLMRNSADSLFIETYTFIDGNYQDKQKCTDTYSSKKTCDTNPTCTPLVENGCQYIVRAYYDELYTSSSVSAATDAEKKLCTISTCTHKVTAKYSQLFSKVDLNRVSACTVDPTTSNSTCPVELRAEFSPDSKFYLITSGGTK